MSRWKSRWSRSRLVKTSTAEPDPVETAQRRAVRGRLHRAAAIARVEHLAEEPLEVDRLRGRPGGGAPLAVDTSLDRPQQSRPAPGRRQHRVEEERRRRLARRARDAGDGQLLGRPPKELVRDHRHRGTRVGDDELRYRYVERVLDDERDRTVPDRLRGEIVAVGALARDAEEERPGIGGSCVVRQIVDRRVGAPDDFRRREHGDQPLQVHDERV